MSVTGDSAHATLLLNRPPSLLQIFLSFLRLGATAFGGPAMIVHIRAMAVQKKRWLDEPTFRNGLALCQTIPGATAMQVCAFVSLSALYTSFHSLPVAVAVFASPRALVVALIVHAAVTFGRAYVKRWQDIVIVPVAAALLWVGISPIFVVMASAVFGLLALFLFDRMLFDLSLIMLRVDLFAFGGGFASVPLMLHEVVDLRHWLDQETFLDGIALGQVTPGPVLITATFVGYVVRGCGGRLCRRRVYFCRPSSFLFRLHLFFPGSTHFRCSVKGSRACSVPSWDCSSACR